MSLTERQESSLDITRNVAVTAGAGSGKTRVLVERYMKILKSSDSILPRNILALTFTEKAASEMKERIKISVKDLLPGDPVKWSRVLDDLPSADISTIHSFCTKLIRNDPIPCGLDPDLRIITETESQEMLKESVNELLTVEGKESSALRRLLVDIGTWNTSRMLISLVRERSRTDMDIGSDEFRARSRKYLEETWNSRLDTALDDLDPLIRHLDGIKDLPVPDVQKDTAVPLMQAMQPVFRLMHGYEDSRETRLKLLSLLNGAREHLLTSSGKERGVGRLGNSRVWGKDHGAVKKCFSLVFSFAFENRELLSIASNPDLKRRARERVKDVLEVYTSLEERFTGKKRMANGVDFDDQISLALMLLQGGSPKLLENLRKRYVHLLVDEFQDTDPRQWKLVDLLWNGGRSSRLFIVGDPKQSIYGFRSADVRLFMDAQRTLRGHKQGKCVVLDRNFRSRKEIMELVNELFPGIMEKEGSRWEVDFDPLEPHRRAEGSVTVMGVLGGRGSEIWEGAKAAELIKKAVRDWNVEDKDGERGLKFGDIAILLPTRKGFQHYENALRAENIPFQVYKGKGFFERQEVKDVLHLLSFITDPVDDLALASALKGPFFGLSDEDLLKISTSGGRSLHEKMVNSGSFPAEADLISRLMEISDSRVPYQALDDIFREIGAHAVMGGARGSRNLDRLVEWAMEESSAGSMPELKERLRRLVEDPPKEGEPPIRVDEDSVSVMTVHAAKGLEWPMVMVLGMNHEPRGGWTRPYNLDPEKGLSIKIMDPATGELVRTPSYLDSQEDQEDKELQERKRLLYVACTRARDHLVLSGSIPMDRYGREREPHGMMRLLWSSMDLSLEELDKGVKMVGGTAVNLIKVSREDLTEAEQDDVGHMEMDQGVEGTSVEVPGPVRGNQPTYLLSPSRILQTDDEKRGIPLDYPDPEGIPPDVMGDMVHSVLQGLPVSRVVRERGLEGSEEKVLELTGAIKEQMDVKGLDPVHTEVEITGELDGEPVIGRIDLIARNREGKLVVVDHKTGRKKEKHLEQVRIYAKLLAGSVDEEIGCDILTPGTQNR
ncbi:MAG: UvrD-helicase domain-containing protein [Thermoplasmatota archaeon]